MDIYVVMLNSSEWGEQPLGWSESKEEARAFLKNYIEASKEEGIFEGGEWTFQDPDFYEYASDCGSYRFRVDLVNKIILRHGHRKH